MKYFLVPILVVGGLAMVLGCWGQCHVSHNRRPTRASTGFSKSVAGFKVRLVAVVDSTPRGLRRLADHAWTPDGRPFEGPESRMSPQSMAMTPGGSLRRSVIFELEPSSRERIGQPASGVPGPPTAIDAFAYLAETGQDRDDRAMNPGAAGPAAMQIWNGIPRDSGGNLILPAPASVAMNFGVQDEDLQTVAFGIAQGDYKVIAKGAASVKGIDENNSAMVGSGTWGRIEVTHLPRPQFESKPSPTHRFRLLGGPYPPKAERKVCFFDSSGRLVASCGDGPNNPGSLGWLMRFQGSSGEIASFEVQERPYEFVEFDSVSFEAPKLTAYAGQDGFEHAVESSIGKVLGVLKSTKDSAWSGSVLYAADGTRWIDPPTDLADLEYGGGDPWNHPLDDRRSILIEPNAELLASKAPTSCEIYAVDTPTGPNKEKLTSWNEMPFRGPISDIPCAKTTRPYMRVELRVGSGTWKTLKTIDMTDAMLKTIATGQPGTRILDVAFHNTGAIWIATDDTTPFPPQAHWLPDGQRARVVARLRTGDLVDIDFNTSGYSGTDPHGDTSRGVSYCKQQNGARVHAGGKSIDVKDIAAFEIQVQDLKEPVKVTLRSPKE